MGIYSDENAASALRSRQLQSLNEVYFGRTPGINAVFNAYCDWRHDFIAKPIIGGATLKNVYNDKLKTFEALVCKQFGLKSFSYTILNKIDVNSFTITSDFKKGAKHIKITKEGYQFDGDASIAIAVYSGLCFSNEYTDEEEFAIFLHEIGHNFQTSANYMSFNLKIASTLYDFADAIADLMIKDDDEKLKQCVLAAALKNDYTLRAFNFISRKIMYNEVAGSLYSVLSFIVAHMKFIESTIRDIKDFMEMPIILLKDGIYSLMKMLMNPFWIERYYGERFADEFAASYGFGDDLSSALSKLDGNGVSLNPLLDKVVGSIPVVSHLYSAACMPGLMLIDVADCHPSYQARAYDILDALKKDLNDPSLSPSLKKQLQEEIDQYEKSMNSYFAKSKKLKNPAVVTAFAQEFIYTKCKGGLKYKLSELPFFLTKDGYRGMTNITADTIRKQDLKEETTMSEFFNDLGLLLEAEDEAKKDEEEKKKEEESKDDDDDDDKDSKDEHDDDTDPEESEDYNDIMGDGDDDDDFGDDFTGNDDDETGDEGADDGDYNAVIMVGEPNADLGADEDVYSHMAKLGYVFTVIANNMKHIHLNTSGRKFEEIHNQAEEYYRHFGYRCDDYFELAKQSAAIELDNPTRAKEHVEDIEVESEKNYPFDLAVSKMYDNITKAIEYLKKARATAGDRHDIESAIDDELGYLHKQADFILRSKMDKTDAMTESFNPILI